MRRRQSKTMGKIKKEIQPQIIVIPEQKTRINGTDIITKSIIIENFSELNIYQSPKFSGFPEYQQKKFFGFFF